MTSARHKRPSISKKQSASGHSSLLEQMAVNTIRLLCVDTVEKANSGHPGMPMGMADSMYVLWSKFLRFNPDDPFWPNRDRFVLSAGHGSALLYTLLHMFGFPITLDDLRQFRQWGSRTPGHPEYNLKMGIETTTGPLGQGFANAVGMALGSRLLGEKFNGNDFSPVDHRVYTLVSDGDLMEGISSEAASLAGHWGLGNLTVLYDDNKITIDGPTSLCFTENVLSRFKAYGWNTMSCDGHDRNSIHDAIQKSIQQTKRPTLIGVRTHIGFGSPNKQDKSAVHGAPLGKAEVELTKANLGWEADKTFVVPEKVRKVFEGRVSELKKSYEVWKKNTSAWRERHPELAVLWDTQRDKSIPEDFVKAVVNSVPNKKEATRVIAGKILQTVANKLPYIIGGSADLNASTKTYIDASSVISRDDFTGRNIAFGIREHAMGGILSGLSLEGGWLPFGSTFLVFSDYMRPSLRLAAMMKIQVIYIFSHDSIFLGEDGPTHQPVEHLAALRLIPGLDVIRPADGLETAMAWVSAVRRKDGPTAICLTRQSVSPIERDVCFDPETILKGGYPLYTPTDGRTDFVLVASGSEVETILQARQGLEKQGFRLKLISMPSITIFKRQPLSYQESVIPPGVPVIAVEAGTGKGWFDLNEKPRMTIGVERFGKSAPTEVLAVQFGLTPDAVIQKIINWMEGRKKG